MKRCPSRVAGTDVSVRDNGQVFIVNTPRFSRLSLEGQLNIDYAKQPRRCSISARNTRRRSPARCSAQNHRKNPKGRHPQS